jgi:hypothetical protein
MRLNVLIGTLTGLLSFGFIAWRVHVTHNRSVFHAAILEDLSASHPGGCLSVQGITEQVLDSHPVSLGSSLLVLAIGDASTANEPRLLGRYLIPANRRIMEGPTAGLRRRQELLDDLKLRCGQLHPTMISPIFQGVKQSVTELRSLGCGIGSDCKLWIDSDLEENAVTAIETMLDHPESKRQVLPVVLNNEGIHVAFCGLAVTAGRIIGPSGREVRISPRRDPNHDDRLRRTWAELFTKPEWVAFEPYCPEASPSSERR